MEGDPLLAITGPTGVGKSALAIELAQRLGGEIVTADSRQVYIGMDIGTAKPDAEEQALARHHLIDLVDPHEAYSLAAFQRQVREVVAGIHGRRRLPIFVGGTPQYVFGVLEGWTVPEVEPDAELRKRLEERAAREGPEALHRELRSADPEAAGKILPTNTRRLVRALEVIHATGRPFSQQQGKAPPSWRIGKLGVTAAREELYRRIDARVDRMIELGLIEEIRRLLAKGYGFDLPSMSGLGYRQFRGYFEGTETLEQAVQQLKWDTHRFVRHQYTWFRRDPGWCWIDTTKGVDTPQVAGMVRRWLDGGELCLDTTPPPKQEGRRRQHRQQADDAG